MAERLASPALRAGLNRGPWFWLALVGLVIGSAVALGHVLAPHWWFAELVTHFTPHSTVGAIVLVGVALAARWRVGVVVGLCLAMVFGGVWASDMGEPAAVSPGGSQVRIAVANVLGGNEMVVDVARSLRDRDADVVGVIELRQPLVDELSGWVDDYPYRHEWPRADNFGMGIYSRLPFVGQPEVLFFAGAPVPVIVATVETPQGRDVEVSLVHTFPPVGRVHAAERDGLLEELSGRLAESGGSEFVVAGDLNLTPWSPVWHRFMERSRAVDSRWGQGSQGSWPVGLGLLKIPIDHVLTSRGIGTVSRETFVVPGSDHLGVVVDLQVPLSSPEAGGVRREP